MATEILRPHDLLPSIWSPNPSPHHHHSKPFKKHRRGERYSNKGAAGALFIGHVKILKRGELIDSIKKKQAVAAADSGSGSGSGSGPKPDRVMKQVRIVADRVECHDNYAGSAFWFSPSPRALPLPRFSTPAVDQSATMDLRRLLRLD